MILTTFVLSTVLTVSYRGCLNSFLAVILPAVRIKTFQDVLDQTSGLVFWPGGQLEATFEASEPDSTEKKLYNQWLHDEDGKVKNYAAGLAQVSNKDYVLIAEEETIRVLPEFACDIVLVEGFHFKASPIAIPFAPGSHLRSAFTTEILKLQNQGVVDRLYVWYFTRRMRKEADCEIRASGLGFANVFTPFACLATGVLVGSGLLALEWVASAGVLGIVIRRPGSSEKALKPAGQQVSRKLSDASAILSLSSN